MAGLYRPGLESRVAPNRTAPNGIIVTMAVSLPADPRRAARGSWPVRVFRLGDEPSDDLTDSTTPEERLAMMWPLALDAWATAGRPLPAYSRDEMPGRVLRTGRTS